MSVKQMILSREGNIDDVNLKNSIQTRGGSHCTDDALAGLPCGPVRVQTSTTYQQYQNYSCADTDCVIRLFLFYWRGFRHL